MTLSVGRWVWRGLPIDRAAGMFIKRRIVFIVVILRAWLVC